MKPRASVIKANGFTLLEMVIVMGIIAVLAGGVIVLMGNIGEGSKIQRASNDIDGIKTALKQYEILGKTYPSTEQGLDALVNRPTSAPVPAKWTKIWDKQQLDPWQNPYYYENNAGKILIGSNGPDGQPNTEDDIRSDQ